LQLEVLLNASFSHGNDNPLFSGTTHMVRFQLGRDAQSMVMRTHRLLWCVRICSGFGLQTFLCDLLVPRAFFTHFRSELCQLKPETLECTHQGIVRNGKQFKT
ncbi:hypothetical protein PIB30_107960, partial [Stylosanthes scabra]|nr:hypothetical protein [Stylosanthes scabra]